MYFSIAFSFPPFISGGVEIRQCFKSFKLKLPRNSGVFTSARLKLKLVNASTLRMVTATGRPTGRPTAAAADRPTADRRGTRCAPQIAEPRGGSTRAWRGAAGPRILEHGSEFHVWGRDFAGRLNGFMVQNDCREGFIVQIALARDLSPTATTSAHA